ncbi:MAG TPA: AraC family transcriptional regulator, partial [Chitinophagaceae bacterium]|nr:AraC family transcriptional regulator [Chitinophagaceae bacterium]
RLSKSWFFRNKDIHSLLINAPAEADYLHQSILQAVQSSAGKLEIDSLVYDLVDGVMENLTEMPIKPLSKSTRKNHLITAERAKQFMSDNFTRDISLSEVAGNSFCSPFHFSRIFKEITSHSPHQYLLRTRLKHAATLIKTSELPVADICFQAGFNNVDYFSAAFSKKYKVPPTRYRSSFPKIQQDFTSEG